MRAIVISDASPVRALYHLNLLPLFKELYGTVLLPEAVARELLKPMRRSPSIMVERYDFFEVRAPSRTWTHLGIPQDLDPGETEAIALALELNATLLLIDERKGTAAARSLGLVTIGVMGVLLEAKSKNLIPLILPLIDQLESGLGFFVSKDLRSRIAALAGE